MAITANDANLKNLSQSELGKIVDSWTSMSGPKRFLANILSRGKAEERFENAERLLGNAPTTNDKALAAHIILNADSDLQTRLITGIPRSGGTGATAKLGNHVLELRDITGEPYGQIVREIYGSVDGKELSNADAKFAWKLFDREIARRRAENSEGNTIKAA